MRTNKLHQTVITEDDFVEIMYSGQEVSQLVVDDTAWGNRFSYLCNLFEVPVDITWEKESTLNSGDYVEDCLADWNLPEEYMQFDIENYVLNKCNTAEQTQRVRLELEEFDKREMMSVLRFLKFFVDALTTRNMVWGVGRGSSVASYVLYLLGVHKVDALKYQLDIKEFLK